MKKIMVAGCSFSAVSATAPGTAWSEVLAQELGWDLVNLARQGCSNGGIRIQIEEIRRQRPDFSIVTPTFWDRMEIPARAAPYDWSKKNQGWDPPLQRHLQDRALNNGYDRTAGINNVNYGNNPYRMICETIFSLAENFPHPYRSGTIDRDTQTDIRHYVDAIYDNAWKKQQDEWIIREGVLQMYLDGLDFLLIPCLLWPWEPNNPALWRGSFPELIPDHYLLLDSALSPQSVSGRYPFDGDDPGYHSSAQGQAVMANNYLAVMRDQFRLGL
jgi:hypothetical protein